ncbi:hypothetical protein SPRG_04091 [Saprolegnia parasitica CBS 223.65]|uniref:Membrane transporter protein n=1 Tax=Saprolegnia parasitica (strain CBS 223.65) TaxID=695850 RepID=A0A067CY56_SAPPC|nr:hypothetical protein SPRG_04091 [Saprolegnia parasitica CBS 223.65]KDO31476.1 hypothetical protein SPRG_04091 [Saprolegnia parasitica CBS 223.65]|eukprot:XP_012198069.1 hypothetical protein SPRG_04091 [Saprolegnia parasitica CBS 223.65]
MWAASVVRRNAATKVSMHRAQPLAKHAPMAMQTSRGAQVGRLQLRQASSTVTKESNQMSWLVASGTGAFAGTVSALTGVGGGIIIIPVNAGQVTGLTQQAINGTSIAAVTVSATVGSVNYLMAGCVNIPMAALVTCSSIFFTKVGVQLAHKCAQPSAPAPRRGAAMLISVPFIYFKHELQARRSDASRSDNISLEKRLDLQYFTHHADSSAYVDAVAKNFPHFCAVNAKYLVAGAISGFVSGLCGLGGGILMTTYLTAASEMPQADIIGTSLLGIVPVGLSSTYHNLQKKSVHLPSALKIGVGLVAGVAITSKYVTLNVSQENLRLILGSTLATSAIVMLKKA